jgi:hypothetical protein
MWTCFGSPVFVLRTCPPESARSISISCLLKPRSVHFSARFRLAACPFAPIIGPAENDDDRGRHRAGLINRFSKNGRITSLRSVAVLLPAWFCPRLRDSAAGFVDVRLVSSASANVTDKVTRMRSTVFSLSSAIRFCASRSLICERSMSPSRIPPASARCGP